MAQDPYQILRVSREASQDEIKNAYRELAKKHHPDLNPGNKEAEARFKEISQAYELIGTPEARATHDRGEQESGPATGGFRSQGRGPFYRRTQEDGAGGRYTYSFGEGRDEDVFEAIFGSRGGRSSAGFAVPGADEVYQMEISLRDAALGAEKEISLPSGKRLAVKIPAGVRDGIRLRFKGQGGPGTEGAPPGDVYIEIRVREDPTFKRDGNALVVELPVSITEAVFGAEVKAPTIDGEVILKIPPRSNSGNRLRLKGKGIFDPARGARGDQIVVLQVMLPETIDPDLEVALRSWRDKHSYNPRESRAA